MLTPFSYENIREYISERCESHFRPLEYINNFQFEMVTREMTQKEASELRKTLRQISKHTEEKIEEAVEEALNDKSVDIESATEIWAAACMLDNALNDRDYSSECIGYGDEYLTAVEMLKQDIAKKKLFSSKPKYNLSVALQNCIDALDCILGIEFESELADKMRAKGCYSEFENLIIDLQNNLSEHINYDDLSKMKLMN